MAAPARSLPRVRAWHFVSEALRDGTAIPRNGVWLAHAGAIRICHTGLHASRDPFDALEYAPGATLCLVDVAGIHEEHGDKLVASHRRIVRRVDARPLLRAFARRCALDVIHLWSAPDIVREYLETGREEIRAAAWDAARDAAWDAAGDAARAAQRQRFRAAVADAFNLATTDVVMPRKAGA